MAAFNFTDLQVISLTQTQCRQVFQPVQNWYSAAKTVISAVVNDRKSQVHPSFELANMSGLKSESFMMPLFSFTRLTLCREGRRCYIFSVFVFSACIYGRHRTEASSKQCNFIVSEPRTAADRMCTDTQCKRSLCNGGSWIHSNRSQSNIIILHTPTLNWKNVTWWKLGSTGKHIFTLHSQ